MLLDRLTVPIVLAPLAGGPSTPQLAAAVSNAGGLGFLASGYLCAAAARTDRQGQIAHDRAARSERLRARQPSPRRYRQLRRALATRPWRRERNSGSRASTTTNGMRNSPCSSRTRSRSRHSRSAAPNRPVLAALRAAGSETWVTVANPSDAEQAAKAGADVLVVQGAEAGGHRASFRDNPDLSDGIGLLPLLQLVRSRTDLPLVAAGGISTGAGVAAYSPQALAPLSSEQRSCAARKPAPRPCTGRRSQEPAPPP